MCGVYWGYQLLRFGLHACQDWWQLRKLDFQARLTRAEVVRLLEAVRTNWGKARFVRRLGGAAQAPTGAWPAGFVLDPEGGEAITLLAQLEERWLGLNR